MPGFKRVEYKDAYDRLASTAKANGFTLKGVTMSRDDPRPIPSYEDIYGPIEAPLLCPFERTIGQHDKQIGTLLTGTSDLLSRVNKLEATLRRISDAV